MQLESNAFSPGERVPRRHSCQGVDVSPPVAWRDPPAGTRSFALICDDPDAPRGTWHHWALFDLQADMFSLDEGYPAGERVGTTRQGVNDFGVARYNGPCPPRGHGPHHYRFKLFALDVERLDVPARATCKEVEAAATRHCLAQAQLMGIYAR